MKLREAFEEYEFSLIERAESTKDWVHKRLKRFIAWCEERQIEIESLKAGDVTRYIEHLRAEPSERTGELLSSHTVHGHARIIRSFINWCDAEGYLDKKPKVHMPRTEKKVTQTLTQEQIKAMFVACDREYSTELAIRDKAILSVLLDTGIRASELYTLILERVHLDPHDAYLLVSGKGFKQREVGLGNKARVTLYKYIHRYRRNIKDEPHVFLTRFGRPFTLNGLDQMLRRLGASARLEGVQVSAHVWRHTYAMNYLKNGGDVYKLSRLMGHTGIAITENYARSLSQREARVGQSVLDSLR